MLSSSAPIVLMATLTFPPLPILPSLRSLVNGLQVMMSRLGAQRIGMEGMEKEVATRVREQQQCAYIKKKAYCSNKLVCVCVHVLFLRVIRVLTTEKSKTLPSWSRTVIDHTVFRFFVSSTKNMYLFSSWRNRIWQRKQERPAIARKAVQRVPLNLTTAAPNASHDPLSVRLRRA